MGNGGDETKPYGWILMQAPQRRPIDHLSHDRLDPQAYTGSLRLRLQAMSPLHIGAGEYTLDSAGRPVQAFIRHAGRPVIPGSTFKGAVRNLVEAVSPSCNPLGEDRCPKSSNNNPTLACPACGLFGFVGQRKSFRGRVRFGDCALEVAPDAPSAAHWLEVLHLPQPFAAHSQGDTLRKIYKHGPLRHGPFPVEVVRAGATFTGEVWFVNLTRDELALLAFALALDGSFWHKLGFGKSSGLGSVKVTLDRAQFRQGPPGQEVDLTRLAREYGARGGPIGQAVQQVRNLLGAPAAKAETSSGSVA